MLAHASPPRVPRSASGCVATFEPDLLMPRKISQVFLDARAETSHSIRVIGNAGEDYRYPADYFFH
jgi:hypothetical protein